jgi:hypothetical protein
MVNIDLKNPVTIFVAVAFGFGSQLWLTWLKCQMGFDVATLTALPHG